MHIVYISCFIHIADISNSHIGNYMGTCISSAKNMLERVVVRQLKSKTTFTNDSMRRRRCNASISRRTLFPKHNYRNVGTCLGIIKYKHIYSIGIHIHMCNRLKAHIQPRTYVLCIQHSATYM